MSDIERNMVKWGNSGKFDPFEDIYSIVFQLTIRAAACREIADSVESCKKLENMFWACEKGTTPSVVLFPWLPSAARKKRVTATTETQVKQFLDPLPNLTLPPMCRYHWIDSLIKARRAEDRREDDTMQKLMDLGDSTAEVIRVSDLVQTP
jgi:hypothetical protein